MGGRFRTLGSQEGTGKKARPALIIQTDALNNAGHPTFIVISGTTDVETLPPSDTFPLRVRVQKTGKLQYGTDLLIGQARAISTRRLMVCYCTVGVNHLKKVEEALRLLTGW